jgi:hypothetical protein
MFSLIRLLMKVDIPLAFREFVIQHQFLTLNFVLVIILYATVQYFATRKIDPREPPIVSSTLPYLGHVLGTLQNGSKYYKTIR